MPPHDNARTTETLGAGSDRKIDDEVTALGSPIDGEATRDEEAFRAAEIVTTS